MGCDMGRKPELSKEEEHEIARYCLEMAQQNFPLTRTELGEVIKQTLDASGRKTCFKDNLPGISLYLTFFIILFQCIPKLFGSCRTFCIHAG